MRSIAIRFAVCTALGVLAGCGGDKDTGDDDDNAGDDEQGGSGGKTTMTGKDAGDPSKPVACGDATCEAVDGDKPCCLNANTDYCGVLRGTSQCAPPVDPRCPSVASDGGVTNPCCTPSGMCGADFSWVGQGCIDLGDSVFRALTPDAPKPRRCDADAGTD